MVGYPRRRTARVQPVQPSESEEEFSSPLPSDESEDERRPAAHRSFQNAIPNGTAAARSTQLQATGGMVLAAAIEDLRREFDESTREQQLRADKLEQEVRRLRLEKEQLQNELRQAKSRRAPKDKSANISEDDTGHVEKITTGSKARDDTIKSLGRKFILLNNLFVNPEWFTATLPPGTTVLDPNRYQNKKTQLYGILAELHEMIPDVYRQYMHTVAFSQLFISAGDAYLRQIILNFRHEGAKHIFAKGGEISEYYKYSYYKERGEMEEFKSAIKWPGDEENSSSSKSKAQRYLLPLHFPGQQRDLTKLFKVKWISLFLRAALFGTTSIEPAALNDPNWKPPHSNGRTWCINKITPGMLAAAATLGVFFHRSDKNFGAKVAGFNYNKAYQYYKKYLLQAMLDGGPRLKAVENLFAWHNGWIFPDSSGCGDGDSDDDCDFGSSSRDQNIDVPGHLALSGAAPSTATEPQAPAPPAPPASDTESEAPIPPSVPAVPVTAQATPAPAAPRASRAKKVQPPRRTQPSRVRK